MIFFGSIEDLFVEIFLEYSQLKLVIDIARLDIQSKVFRHFDPYKWIDRVAHQTYLVHFSNVHYADHHFKHHLPVQRKQDDDQSYGDSFHYLAYLSKIQTEFHITFEHNPYKVSQDELHHVYQRVYELVHKNT